MAKNLVKVVEKLMPLEGSRVTLMFIKGVEREIKSGFDHYRRDVEKGYYRQITYNRIVFLARIGQKDLAKEYAQKFEREMGSKQVQEIR